MFSSLWLTVSLVAASVFAQTNQTDPVFETNRVKLVGFLKRKEGLTKDEFVTHWLNHGKLFRSLNISNVITKYEEVLVDDEINNMLKASGVLVSDFDGLAIMEGESFATILAALSSDEHNEIIIPDEETFLDRNATVTMPATFANIISERDPVTDPGAPSSPGNGTTNGTTTACCDALNTQIPGKVSLPGSPLYTEEGSEYYSTSVASQTPACRFTPDSADDVAAALKVLIQGKCEFAVKSAGHNPWKNMSNIDNGVTIDMLHLANTTVSDAAGGSKIAHVGPGARWGGVYDILDTHNITAVGGRATTVGVGGFLLGGGLSYFNAQHGFAAQNVINYEMVLANSTIVNVNASSYPDLYTALNGGSTNFGIVTKYTLKTFPLVPMYGGFRNYNISQSAALIKGTNDFMEKQVKDVRAGGAIFSYQRPFNTTEVRLAMLAAYFNGDGPLTDAMDGIIGVPPLPGTDGFQNNTNQQTLAGAVDTRFSGGSRAMFSTLSFVADVQFPQDIYKMAKQMFDARFPTKNISWALSFQANGRAQWIQIAKTPNYQNVPTDKHLYVFVLVSYNLDEEDDASLTEWHHEVMDWMAKESKKRKLDSDWLYMNYGRPDQDVYSGFGKKNHAAMKSIKAKYDPENVFGTLWQGGFKL